MVFIDRQSKYPGRWTMKKSDGTTELVTLERNDEPIVKGTPLNAETLNELSTVAGAINAKEAAETAAAAAAESQKSASTSATNAQYSAEKAEATLEEFIGMMDNVAIDVDDLGLYQDPDTGYVYPTYRGEVSENGIPLASFGGGSGGGGGGGSANNAVLTVTNKTGWLAKTISKDGECKVSFAWSSTEDDMPTGNGTLTVKVDGVKKLSKDIAQGNVEVDLTSYLTSGTNKVKVTVSDVYDNSRTITYTVTVVELTIKSSFDTSVPYDAGVALSYTYIPTGAVDKTVRFVLDGNEVATAVIATSGRQQTQQLPSMSHGAHSLLVYFTAEIDGEVVRSNDLYSELIIVAEGNTTPIITSTLRLTTAVQYTSLVIPYMVYTSATMTPTVTLSINGEESNTIKIDRTEQTWTVQLDKVGTQKLSIQCEGTKKEWSIEVTESEINVDPETDALSLYLTSYGRSNGEESPAQWTSGDVAATLTGFTFVSDGWLPDADGITALRISGDARVEIPFKPFAKDFRTSGKTIELEFATSNVLDYDAVIMSCMSNGKGFELTAQKAMLSSEQSTVETQYKEDEHVRIAFVVQKKSENRLIQVYINGIMSGTVQYPAEDDFSQQTPVNITIGSDKCAIDVYTIRIYENDLTRHQVVNNWIADTQNGDEKLARYNRNNVYDAYGEIVIAQLPPETPYMVLSALALPQYKGDKKTVSGYYVDPVDGTKSFTFVGATADVQGTSSQTYARKNYKIKFANGFVLADGTKSDTYQLRTNSIGTATFTFKADVASSEGANNVELVRLYNDACPYQTPAQQVNPSIRQGIDGLPIVMFWDNGTGITFIGKQAC